MVIVSDKAGTTTGSRNKSHGAFPYGPIALTDTAGLGDSTEIGVQRMKKDEKNS